MLMWEIYGSMAHPRFSIARDRRVGALTMGAAQLFSHTGIPLMGLSPRDPLTHGTVAVVLLLAALGAMTGPARRASRVDPLLSLRRE